MATYDVDRGVKLREGEHTDEEIFLRVCSYQTGGRTYYGTFEVGNGIKVFELGTRLYTATTTNVRYYSTSGSEVIVRDVVMRQNVTARFVAKPTINIKDNLGVISDACEIEYTISDGSPELRYNIVYKLNNDTIGQIVNTVDSKYKISLTDEYLSKLSHNSTNHIVIEFNDFNNRNMLTKTVTFTKGNTKPKLNITSYNSTTAIFTAIDTDNNLSKIEWFIDDVLKETITTDLYLEKTINYELTDNAIHTLKIVATDAENATTEKVLSISKEIMPLQTDATLQDISTKLIEIGEGFKNGKTSIINTLALKNIDSSLNNTLVELSEKIKASFDSGDASLQDLINQLTQANNTISQLNSKYKVASGTVTSFKGDDTKIAYPYLTDRVFKPSAWVKISNLDFKPNIFFADFDYYDTEYKNNYKLFLFACCGVATQRGVDFSSVTSFIRKSSDEYFHANGWLYNNSEGDVYFNNTGVQIPAYSFDSTQRHIYKWYAIKFI
ncbi:MULTISPECIES: hypothetical protein [unclassified Clostridioides]|uniref:hypothetical protein n=1 Tax=unclassified Clostridioides TaxID=2635829 RepID=UPI001D12AA7F|nr:hypothetical protein [Clostridioides sp. ZZV14-6150]MCC0724413.1 hypothetical protein [Clostridioides sp. ZZV14-6104]MCC0742144.1 hypothetical protein [Clostridioides sp. ZZV14-6044]MCC0753090.1 hypothetical protein [Clostridioides sp. ZZV13-5731]